MSYKEIDEILNSYSWIKVKRFNQDSTYDELMEHHIEETTFLLIGNNKGGINGWTKQVFGKVIEIIS